MFGTAQKENLIRLVSYLITAFRLSIHGIIGEWNEQSQSSSDLFSLQHFLINLK